LLHDVLVLLHYWHSTAIVMATTLLVMQIKGPNVPKDALAGGGDLPDTAGLDTLGKIADKAGEKVSKSQCLCTSYSWSVTTSL